MNWFETPRGLAVITGVLLVLFAGVGFWIGYDIGRNPAPVALQFVLPPGTTIQVQPAPAIGKP